MKEKRIYRDLYNSFKDDPDKALKELRHKAYVEGYGEFKRLNKRYFDHLTAQNETD